MKKQNFDSGTVQEWKVFRALCPPELMAIIDDPNITPLAWDSVCQMFHCLGFAHLEHEYLFERAFRFPQQGGDPQSSDIHVQPLLNLFLGNIQSPGLRSLFEENLTR